MTAVFIEIDESEGSHTIAQMDGDPNHELACSGTINIDGTQYELSKMKGRGNATWRNGTDKLPYNITLGKKINWPGLDSENLVQQSIYCPRERLGLVRRRISVHQKLHGQVQRPVLLHPRLLPRS